MDLFDDTASLPRRSFAEYLEIPLRRPWLVILPFATIVAGSFLATMLLPARYRSSTFIMVESEQVPAAVVPKMASTDRVARRLQTIKQEILSRTRLEQVIKETNPYPELGPASTGATVEVMRTSTEIMVRGPDAFTVEYIHTDPRKAAEVANRIATLFIEEANRARAQQVEEAYGFLETQVGEVRKQLEAKEEAVRRYKEAHMGSLPEQAMANLTTLQRLQQQAQALGEELRGALDRQAELERQLADVSRGVPVPELEGPRKEISQLRSQLASLRTRYTDEHPDIQQLLTRLKMLESSLPSEPSASGSASNPGRSTAELRLEQARREVALVQEKRAAIEGRIAALQGRIDAIPRVEQELTTISRDFGNLKENYLGLVNKKLDAEMAAKLEERWKGERFRILDPAHVPERPFFPNPVLFVTGGVVLGLLVGLGAAVLADVLDHSFKNIAELEAALPYPVLATVPYVKPGRPSRRPRPAKPAKSARGRGKSLLEL